MGRAKIGRNQPCPCGSNKKYKKCCLGKMSLPGATYHISGTIPRGPAVSHDGQRLRGRSAALVSQGLAQQHPELSIPPHTIIRMLESVDESDLTGISDASSLLQRERSRRWTPARIAGMETEAIEEQLRILGVVHSRERFLSLAANRTSAWSIAETWIAEDPVHCDGTDDDDFFGLAACELWKRWIPDTPSMEMLDDWMQGGYEHMRQNADAAACDIWWRVWQALLPRFEPAMTTMHTTADVFQGVQSVFNWSQDFETGLINASIDDPRYAEIGRRYCEQWIAQFTEDDMQVGIRRALACFLFRLGRIDEGVSILQGIIDTWPSNPCGYIALADVHANLWSPSSPLRRDLQRAEELLNQGLAVIGDDRERSVLHQRLRSVREKMESASDSR